MFPGIVSNVAPTVTTSSGAATISIGYPEDIKAEAPEKQYSEYFSKSLLDRKIQEFKAGKLTLKYVMTYLDFMHISGYLSNLEYLEYKPQLKEE